MSKIKLMKPRSLVWRFFERLFQNGKAVAVECKLCDQEYKYFGNTTNLKQHLLRRHPIQWDIAENETARKRLEEAEGKDIDCVDLSDNDHETETVTAQPIPQVNHKDSDEEWLDDQFQNTQEESYEVPRKKRKQMKIKREVQSPKHYHSQPPSTPTFEQGLANSTIYIPADNQPTRDEYSVFGEYIANKMRKFKSPRTRGNLQQVITTMLWQAEYGLYDSCNAVKRILMLSLESQQSSNGVTSGNQEETVSQEQEQIVLAQEATDNQSAVQIIHKTEHSVVQDES